MKTANNNTGSTILALSGLITQTWGKQPPGRAIGCIIALEKEGVIRPIADRIKSGLALTEKAYQTFKDLSAKEGPEGEGAMKALKIATEFKDRSASIVAYKAAQAAEKAGEPVTA